MTGNILAQDLKAKDAPEAVRTACTQKFPNAKKISWEKEKGNYEANWGGKSVKIILQYSLLRHPFYK